MRDTVTAVDRTYHVLGVPLRTGSLYPGSENDAQPYRDAAAELPAPSLLLRADHVID